MLYKTYIINHNKMPICIQLKIQIMPIGWGMERVQVWCHWSWVCPDGCWLKRGIDPQPHAIEIQGHREAVVHQQILFEVPWTGPWFSLTVLLSVFLASAWRSLSRRGLVISTPARRGCSPTSVKGRRKKKILPQNLRCLAPPLWKQTNRWMIG